MEGKEEEVVGVGVEVEAIAEDVAADVIIIIFNLHNSKYTCRCNTKTKSMW